MIHDLSDSSAAPASFGPFRVLHQIGVGVLGPVYRAQDSVRDQLVAVKAFKVDAPPEQAEEIADALRDVAHALPRHRGLLEYIASGVERSTPYLVMAHSDVPSLDTKLKPGVPLDAEAALDLIATLADAIDAAHAKGIIHGTLHPRDVFVDDRGGCRISGFGVATALAGAGIRAVPVRRPYSPPERVVGGPIERSADLFALGALAFELFSGRRVVGTGLDAAVRFAVSASDVDMEHLRTALAAMLAENPVHRPSSATAFAQAVTQAVRPRGLTPEAGRKRVTPSEIKMSTAGAAGAFGAAAAGAGMARAPEAAPSGASSSSSSNSPETLKLSQDQLHDRAAADADDAQQSDSDALALFTRQGTLWEANRPSETEPVRLETVTVAPDEDPLAQFSSESDSASAAASQRERARESAGPETQPLRIHDESSDEEVQSIADAARAIAVRAPAGSSPSTSTSSVPPPSSSSTAAATAAAAAADRAAAERASDDMPEVLTEPHAPLVQHDFEYLSGRAALASGSHTASAFDARASAASESAAERAAVSILASDRDRGDHDRGQTQAHDRLRDRAPEQDHDHDRVLTGLRGWTPAEEAEAGESGSNPLRVLAMVLAIGLAVGVAGGYLLGQRSALRQALALFRGDQSSQSSNGDAASSATPAANPSAPAAATTPPTEVSEPTVVPEGSTAASPRGERQPPQRAASDRAGSNRATPGTPAANTPGTRAASAAKAPAAAAPAAAAAAPTKGQLLVRSSPARAEVTVNGVRRGETPVTLRDLPFGTHTIRVTRNGYVAATRKVTLSASRTADPLEFDLERESTPSRVATGAAAAASAARDRERVGSAAGGGIVAAGGDPDAERASAEATAAGLGALYVLSHPAGARVLVDGQYVGSTPLLVTNVPPGTKTIKLELPGHKPWSSSVRVAAGQRVRVAASLEEGTN